MRRMAIVACIGVALLLIQQLPLGALLAGWPALGTAEHWFAASSRGQAISHLVLFWLFGLILLWAVPVLRRRIGLFAGVILAVALAQEALQLLRFPGWPDYYDARDVVLDLGSALIAWAMVWLISRRSQQVTAQKTNSKTT